MCGCSSRTRRTRPSASASCFGSRARVPARRRPDDVRPHHAADANMDRPQGRASRHAGRHRRHRFRGHQAVAASRALAAASGERRRYATVRTASCGTAGRVRLDCRRGRRELDGARLARLRHDDPHLTNKFAWYGTPSTFDTLTQTFVENQHGAFNAHHYRHSREMSTFIVECDAETWGRAGFVDGRARHARLPREAVWASPGVEQVCMAQFSEPAQSTLACGKHGAHRRRVAHRAFLHRLGHLLAKEDAKALAKALDNSTLSQTLRLRAAPLSRSSLRRRMPALRGTTPSQGT